MMTYTQDGVLVLADISGFTEFVTATELEHGPQIIAALLEAVMGRLAPPLEIQEVEGDGHSPCRRINNARLPAVTMAAARTGLAHSGVRVRSHELTTLPRTK